MKNKKTFIAIVIISLLILTGAYFLFFYESFRVSKKVNITTYKEVFNNFVTLKYKKSFSELSEPEKFSALKQALSNQDFRIGVYAAFSASELKDKNKIISLFNNTEELKYSQVTDEILSTLIKIDDPATLPVAQKIFEKYKKNDDYLIPFSDASSFFIVGKSNDKSIDFNLNENNACAVFYDNPEVYEINLLFPENPDWFIYLPDFDNNYKKFISLDFIKDFKKLAIYDDLPNAPFINKIFKLDNLLRNKLGIVAGLLNPENIFKDNLSIAKYDDDYLFVTFTGKNIKVLELLFNVGSQVSDEYRLSPIEFKNVKYISLKFGNESVFIADIEDYLCIATSEELIKKSINTFLNERDKSLTADPLFNECYNKVDMYGKDNFCLIYGKPTALIGLEKSENNSAYICRKSETIIKKFSDNKIKTEIRNLNFAGMLKDTTGLLTLNINKINYTDLWNYFIKVRAKSQGAVDSVLRKIKIEPAKNLFQKFGNTMTFKYSGISYSIGNYSYASLMNLIKIPLVDTINIDRNIITAFQGIFGKEPNKIVNNNLLIYSFLEERPVNVEYDPIPRVFCVNNGNLYFASSQHLIRDYINQLPEFIIDNDSTKIVDSKIKFKSMLIDFYKYLQVLANRSSRISYYDVEKGLKPFLKHLSKISEFEFFINDDKGNYSGKFSFPVP